MENLTTADLISIFTSIATWVTALLVLFSVLEMGKQRKASYKPEVVPTRQLIHAGKSPITALKIPHFWLEHRPEELKESIQISDYAVTLHNVGNGAANNISCEWNFSIQDAVRTINEMSQKCFRKLYLDYSEKGQLSLKTEAGNAYTVNLRLDANRSYDHLVSAAIDRNGLRVRVPSSFILIISTLYQLVSLASGEGGYKLNDSKVPSITLNVNYNDIGGKRYQKSYEFFVHLVALSIVKDEEVCMFEAVLEYK